MMFKFSFSVSIEAKTVFVSAWVSILRMRGWRGPDQPATSGASWYDDSCTGFCSSRPSVAPGVWATTLASWMVLLSAPSQGQNGELGGLVQARDHRGESTKAIKRPNFAGMLPVLKEQPCAALHTQIIA